MTIRPIIRYPDPRLALAAQPVTVFDEALRDLARDLLDTGGRPLATRFSDRRSP